MNLVGKIGGMLAAGAALTVCGAANATILVDNFTLNDVFGSPALVAPYGTVTLNDFGSTGSVLVQVALLDGLEFHDPADLNHWEFAFNLSAGATFSSVTDNDAAHQTFAVAAGPANLAPFGSFAYRVSCTADCLKGYGAGGASTLSFTILEPGINVNSFTPTASATYGNVLFGADVVRSNSLTGNIGALGGGPGGVPEPASWAMMLVGFGGLGALLRRRRRQVSAAFA